jgi:hypothetical protein
MEPMFQEHWQGKQLADHEALLNPTNGHIERFADLMRRPTRRR